MQNKPRIIGVTGGSGVGKGEVCRVLAGLGTDVLIIDADRVAHGVILAGKPAYDKVLVAFGDGILGDDGEIARKKLGAIVFADKAQLSILSDIVHKYVRKECEDIVAANPDRVIVIDAAALVEGDMIGDCDVVIGVFAEHDLRAKRISVRDHISLDAAKQRIASQMADDVLRGHVDVVVENSGTLEELREKVRKLGIL